MKKIAVLRFHGTNCDHDILNACNSLSIPAEIVWCKDHFAINDYAALIIPGGFSYGDYLRSGAMAARTPVMESVREANEKGLPILGICNGFQILTEAGLLPGALLQNDVGHFIDNVQELIIENTSPYFANSTIAGQHCHLPIAHGDGRYYADSDTLKQMQEQGLIWLKYRTNPNGSLLNIAGIMNLKKNCAALMPHPERAMKDWMGSTDGVMFFSHLKEII